MQKRFNAFVIRKFVKQLSPSAKYLLYAIAAFIIFLIARNYNEYLKTECYKILLPAKAFLHDRIRVIVDFKSIMNLKNQNDTLKKENQALLLTIKKLEKRFADKAEINAIKAKSANQIERVIGFEQSMFDSSIIISMSEPRPANTVVCSNEGLVGIVLYCSGNYGLVRSITDSRMSVPVKTKSGELFILCGTNSNLLEASESKSGNFSKIKLNETLYTSGEGGIFPKNIPVATVVSFSQSTLIAKPTANFSSINFLEILPNNPLL